MTSLTAVHSLPVERPVPDKPPADKPPADRPLATIWRVGDDLWAHVQPVLDELDPFPDDSTVHRTMQRWVETGVFARVWALLVEECEALGGVLFAWQAVDTSMGKRARAATRWAPTRPTAADRV